MLNADDGMHFKSWWVSFWIPLFFWNSNKVYVVEWCSLLRDQNSEMTKIIFLIMLEEIVIKMNMKNIHVQWKNDKRKNYVG